MALRGIGLMDTMFGDGSDGFFVLTGTLSLKRDMYYENLIFSASGPTTPFITTNSNRIFVRRRLAFVTSGTIDNSGFTGDSTGTNTSGSISGSLGATCAFGGQEFGVPLQPPAFLATFGGSGGSGSSFNLGGPPGLTGSTAIPPFTSSGSIFDGIFATSGRTFGGAGAQFINGGGAGGGSQVVQGGYGGGVIMISAREIFSSGSVTGTLSAQGGHGSSGGGFPATGSTNVPSGGGGGGVIIVLSSLYSASLLTNVSGGFIIGQNSTAPAQAGTSGSVFFLTVGTT